jgi:hypothetical protein
MLSLRFSPRHELGRQAPQVCRGRDQDGPTSERMNVPEQLLQAGEGSVAGKNTSMRFTLEADQVRAAWT